MHEWVSESWHLTRLGRDGTVHWTTSSELADLQQVADGQGIVICSGFADHSEPTGKRPDLMVFVDEVTGESHTMKLGEGESQGTGE